MSREQHYDSAKYTVYVSEETKQEYRVVWELKPVSWRRYHWAYLLIDGTKAGHRILTSKEWGWLKEWMEIGMEAQLEHNTDWATHEKLMSMFETFQEPYASEEGEERYEAKRMSSRKAEGMPEGSAHPANPNYDMTFAQQLMGDLAEHVRAWFADKHEARPPGLQTQANPDGSIMVRADNPESGIGMEVTISMLQQQPAMDQGIGPPPAAPAPAPQAQVGPPAAPVPAPTPAVGPPSV